MSYDYHEGKKRVLDILNNSLEVIQRDDVPGGQSFTFENSYYSWVTGLFVDIRNSTSLFSDADKIKVSKIIRSFTSEVIDILKDDDNYREIGIRGDCVYGIYSSPTKKSIYDILDKSFYVNTYMKMLNALLSQKKYPNISVGIGVATAKELIVKAGRKNSGINNLVWIGNAVALAAKLSGLGSKKQISPIVVSKTTYENSIEQIIKDSGEKARAWFNRHVDPDYDVYYDCGLVKSDFSGWIDNGMR